MTDSTQQTTIYFSEKTYRKSNIVDTPILNFKSMDDATKARITEEQVEDYRDKYATMRIDAKEDMKLAKLQHREVIALIQKLYGNSCKQSKYMERQTGYDMEGTEMYNHYAKYDSPRLVEEEIKISKGKVSSRGREGVNGNAIAPSESNIQDIDKAIKYLTQEGYTYSLDFTSHNAVSIALALGMENVMLDLVDTDCKECVLQKSLHSDDMKDSIECNLIPSLSSSPNELHSDSGLNVINHDNLIKVVCNNNHISDYYGVELSEINGQVKAQKRIQTNE